MRGILAIFGLFVCSLSSAQPLEGDINSPGKKSNLHWLNDGSIIYTIEENQQIRCKRFVENSLGYWKEEENEFTVFFNTVLIEHSGLSSFSFDRHFESVHFLFQNKKTSIYYSHKTENNWLALHRIKRSDLSEYNQLYSDKWGICIYGNDNNYRSFSGYPEYLDKGYFDYKLRSGFSYKFRVDSTIQKWKYIAGKHFYLANDLDSSIQFSYFVNRWKQIKLT